MTPYIKRIAPHIRILPFILLCVLSACASLPSVTPYRISDNTAVVALADEAYNLATMEKYDQAKSKIERALRMEPKNAALWLELARINKYQGDYDDALNLALRAKALTQDPRLEENIQLFINTLQQPDNVYVF